MFAEIYNPFYVYARLVALDHVQVSQRALGITSQANDLAVQVRYEEMFLEDSGKRHTSTCDSAC